MKILVCIKQVLDRDVRLELKPGGRWPVENADTSYRINRYDDYALEEALQIKDKTPGAEIHVVSVGPPRVTLAINRALAKGADHGIHLPCDSPSLSAFETATLIAGYARDRGFDLILTGVMSEDAMQSQVGPMLAAILSLPCTVAVVALENVPDGGHLLVDAELEGGTRAKVQVPMPALVTVQTSDRQPRYPSLSNILRAKEKDIRTLDAGKISVSEAREEFLALTVPAPASKGRVLSGTTAEKADQLLKILHERSLL